MYTAWATFLTDLTAIEGYICCTCVQIYTGPQTSQGTTFVVVFVFVSVLTDWLHSFCSVCLLLEFV